MTEQQLEGMVIRAQSGFFTVHTPQGDYVCEVRGRLKKERLDTDLLAVGDQVAIVVLRQGRGTIVEVKPRERALARLAPHPGGRGSRRWDRNGYLSEREQVLVANPDQAVVIFAATEPDPHLRMLDRLLVGAEVQHIPTLICVNKVDLAELQEVEDLFSTYRHIGYPVLYTSAVTGMGVPALRDRLHNKLSVLIGPSGVGKSSLLNAIQPHLGLAVQQVSQATSKGRHTTVVPQLFPLDVGGWVADTPGIRALALFDVDPEEVDSYFPEIAPLVADCQFSDCTHTVEPGCAVIEAVEQGRVSEQRYESYVRLREEHQRLADMYWWGIE